MVNMNPVNVNATGDLKKYDIAGGKKGGSDGKITYQDLQKILSNPESRKAFIADLSHAQEVLTTKINNPSIGLNDKNSALQEFFNNQQVLDLAKDDKKISMEKIHDYLKGINKEIFDDIEKIINKKDIHGESIMEHSVNRCLVVM